tara:strand:- start:125 stop:247 length:123 start_codon:yes stop_codon:yes gene_type:complete
MLLKILIPKLMEIYSTRKKLDKKYARERDKEFTLSRLFIS